MPSLRCRDATLLDGNSPATFETTTMHFSISSTQNGPWVIERYSSAGQVSTIMTARFFDVDFYIVTLWRDDHLIGCRFTAAPFIEAQALLGS